MTAANLLEVTGLRVTLGAGTVLRDVDLAIRPGGPFDLKVHGQPVDLEQRPVAHRLTCACSKSLSPRMLNAITTATMHAPAASAGSG